MDEQLENFLRFIGGERALSTNYQLGLQRCLDTFRKWLAGRGISDFQAATPRDLTDFLAARKSAGLEASSIRFEAVALRVFYRYTAAICKWPSNPAEHLALPRGARTLPDTLGKEHIARLLEVVGGKTPQQIRDRAILEVLYAGGLRVSELCNARLENLNLDEGWMRVTGKGAKTRLVPLGRPAMECLSTYLGEVRPQLVNRHSGAEIFLSLRGRKLTPQRIWQLIKLYAHHAGIEQNVFPHLMRHSFATHLLGGGADLRVIQELLGHADISTTQVYTHVETSALRNVIKKFHPRG